MTNEAVKKLIKPGQLPGDMIFETASNLNWSDLIAYSSQNKRGLSASVRDSSHPI